MRCDHIIPFPRRSYRENRRFHRVVCACPYCPSRRRPAATFNLACNVLWTVRWAGWTQAHTANELKLNQATVSRIVRGLMFPHAYPVPIARYQGRVCRRQGAFDF